MTYSMMLYGSCCACLCLCVVVECACLFADCCVMLYGCLLFLCFLVLVRTVACVMLNVFVSVCCNVV